MTRYSRTEIAGMLLILLATIVCAAVAWYEHVCYERMNDRLPPAVVIQPVYAIPDSNAVPAKKESGHQSRKKKSKKTSHAKTGRQSENYDEIYQTVPADYPEN